MPELEKAKVFMTGRSQAVGVRQDPQPGEITLSDRPEKPSLTEIFRMIDAAGEAEGPFELDRDMRLPEDRDYF